MSNKNNRRGMSMKTKWIITGVLCVLAVLTVIVVAADGCFDFKPGSVKSNNKDVVESAAPADEKDTSKSGGTHTVFVTAGNGGATDPNGSVSVEDYGSVTITITPYDGYEIQSVTVDGQDKLHSVKRHRGSQHHRHICQEGSSHAYANAGTGNSRAGRR